VGYLRWWYWTWLSWEPLPPSSGFDWSMWSLRSLFITGKTQAIFFKFGGGGFVSFGAFLGLAVSWLIYLKIRKLDILRYMDHMVLFAVPIIIFTVRIGCFMAGCCFGKPSAFHDFEYLLYVTFTNRAGDAGNLFPGVALWPVQIWASFYAILIFLILYWVEGRNKFKGQIIVTFFFVYSLFRFNMEFFRGDISRGVYLDQTISTGQVASAIIFMLSIVFWFIFKKNFPLEKPYPRIPPPKESISPSKANPTAP